MLRKLLKYDIRATMLWYLLTGGVALLLAAATRVSFVFFDTDRPLSVIALFGAGSLLVLAVSVLALFALVIPIVRFYKNLLCDEGYLMFTLPVSSGQLYASKLLTAMLGEAFMFLVLALGGAIVILTNREAIQALKELFPVLKTVFVMLSGGQLAVGIVEAVVYFLVLLVYPFAVAFASLSFGQLANKNKLLYSFLAYLVINSAGSVLQWITQLFFMIPSIASDTPETFPIVLTEIQYGVQIFVTAAITVVCIVLANRILKKKLNLE